MKTVYGIPIPLRYLTPNLLFYPLRLPKNFLCIFMDKKINWINEQFTLNNEDHLLFVKKLMTSLDISYIIVGNFLIDLTRNDFVLTIDENLLNISSYESVKDVLYIEDKYFKNILKNLELNHEICNKHDNVNEYIHYHCSRISYNTKIIKNYFLAIERNVLKTPSPNTL